MQQLIPLILRVFRRCSRCAAVIVGRVGMYPSASAQSWPDLSSISVVRLSIQKRTALNAAMSVPARKGA